VTWYASDPDPASNNSLYQSDGIYNGTNTVWTAPYISSLKVGQLSAITVNTGSLTVDGALTIGSSGQILGGQTAYAPGTGFFLGYSSTTYKFSIGSSTQSLQWDGSALTVTGNFYGNGNAEFSGASSSAFSLTMSVKGNSASAADIGIFGQSKATGSSFGVYGFTPSSAGVGGQFSTNNASGIGVSAQNTAGGVGLQIIGNMTISGTTEVLNLNANKLQSKVAADFVQVASGTTNAKYLYFVNNNTAPTDPTNRAAWIKVSTNDGAVVWFPGYI
jgi:hypothetical protein